MSKKLLSLVVMFVMLISLAACSNPFSKTTDVNSGAEATVPSTEGTDTATVEDTATAEETNAAEVEAIAPEVATGTVTGSNELPVVPTEAAAQ